MAIYLAGQSKTKTKVNYAEFAAWAQDRLADVAVDDINYTTRSHVDVGAIQAKAQAKIGA